MLLFTDYLIILSKSSLKINFPVLVHPLDALLLGHSCNVSLYLDFS